MDSEDRRPIEARPVDDGEGEDLPPARGWLLRTMAIVAVIGLASFFLLRPAPERSITSLPEFDLPLLNGEGRLTSADIEGAPTVVNFWASWCGPCREEAPLLERTWRRYKDEGVRFLGVDVKDSPDKAKRFVEEFDLTYPIVTDLDQELFKQVESIGLPLTLFVEADGDLLPNALIGRAEGGENRIIGAIDAAELERRIEELLEREAQQT